MIRAVCSLKLNRPVLPDFRYAIYDYDELNRLVQRDFSTKTHLFYNYIYKKSDNRNTSGSEKYQTTQVKEEYIGNDVYIYGYDVLGYITSIKTATRSGDRANSTNHTTATDYASYTYDDLGQLTRENLAGKKTTAWTYDILGNITSKSEYAYTMGTLGTATKTVTYGYGKDGKNGWNNLLVSVDANGNGTTDSGETINYDKIGNPTTYLGATLTWNGRQLTSYTKGDTISYKYDADGLRTLKSVNGAKTKYYYVNGKLHYEERSDGTKLYFFYDSNGYLTCINHNGSTNYYPATNLRGDVVALYRHTGALLATYEYDAWGNVIAVKDATGNAITDQSHIANLNPIRYRGYYYDTETKLYYLQSRYYNAEVGRFLNADGYLTTGQGVLSYNMFAYCGNNPVMYSDPSGHCLKKAWNWLSEKWNYVKTKINRFIYKDQVLEYESINEAAIASGSDLNSRTQTDNMEHGQGIVYNSKTDTYGLTDVIDGEHSSVSFSSVLSNEAVVALVHSHPYCTGHVPNAFSNTIQNGDLVSGDWLVASSNEVDLYLAAPDGNLYIMEWDVGEYNQTWVSSGLPIDNSMFECTQ